MKGIPRPTPRLLVLAATALLLAACSSSGNGGKPQKGGGSGGGIHLVLTTPAPKGPLSSITWDLPTGEPTTLDYVKAADYAPDLMISNLCDNLLRLTPSWGVQPGLATSWQYANPKTLVFDIRHGVRFWDGHTLTAADVVYSMLRNLNPKDGPVNGAFYTSVKSIKQTGTYQVTVSFSQPDELFVKEMATIAGSVAEKSYLLAKGNLFGTAKGGLECTGPYELKAWNAGSDIVLQANPHYWDPAYTPKVATVDVKFVSESSTLTSALLSGAIDGAYEVPPTSYTELKTASSGKLYFGPSLSVTELAASATSGPFANPAIRSALGMAINRAAVAKVVYDGAAAPNKALTPPTAWDTAGRPVYEAAYANLPSLTPNVAAAKKIVQGIPGHSTPITLALLAGDQSELEIATVVQQAAQQIGLTVKLDQMQPLAFSNAFFLSQYRKGIDALVTVGYLDVPDPLDYLGLFFGSGAIFNWTNYNNPTVNADLAQARQTYDAVKRAHLVTAAQAIYMRDEIVIPLVNADEGLFMNKAITGAPASFAYIYEPCLAKIGAAK